MPVFYIVHSDTKKSKQARVTPFVWLFRDDATTAKGPGCDEGTNLRDFVVVPLMPTCGEGGGGDNDVLKIFFYFLYV